MPLAQNSEPQKGSDILKEAEDHEVVKDKSILRMMRMITKPSPTLNVKCRISPRCFVMRKAMIEIPRAPVVGMVEQPSLGSLVNSFRQTDLFYQKL